MVEQSAFADDNQQVVVDTKKCGMCQKDIEQAKFRLHEVACARMNYKCTKCGEIVPKVDREQHEDDVHSDKPLLNCDLCNQFSTKQADELASHKKDMCGSRPQPVQMPTASNQPARTQMPASGQSQLEKCLYCIMEFTPDQIQNHISYCGSKTKECPDCFKPIQNWLLQSHKDTGECANICLDRQENDDQSQFRQALAASNQPIPSAAVAPAVGGVAAGVNDIFGAGNAAVPNDSMDENEREIARIMQEEANAMDPNANAHGGSQQPMENFPGDFGGQQQQYGAGGDDPSGVRAPDEARYQSLTGPDADYDPEADRRDLLEYQRRNHGVMGDINSSIASAASAFGRLIGIGGGNPQPEPAQMQQPQRPGGDNYGMSEEEKQMQMAMEASMMGEGGNAGAGADVQAQQQMPQPGGEETGLNNEDAMMARAIAESMSVNQISAQNDMYQQQVAGSFEDEDAMLARALAESQQNM